MVFIAWLFWTCSVFAVSAAAGLLATYNPTARSSSEDYLQFGFLIFLGINALGQIIFYTWSKQRKIERSVVASGNEPRNERILPTGTMSKFLYSFVAVVVFLLLLGFLATSLSIGIGMLSQTLSEPASLLENFSGLSLQLNFLGISVLIILLMYQGGTDAWRHLKAPDSEVIVLSEERAVRKFIYRGGILLLLGMISSLLFILAIFGVLGNMTDVIFELTELGILVLAIYIFFRSY